MARDYYGRDPFHEEAERFAEKMDDPCLERVGGSWIKDDIAYDAAIDEHFHEIQEMEKEKKKGSKEWTREDQILANQEEMGGQPDTRRKLFDDETWEWRESSDYENQFEW